MCGVKEECAVFGIYIDPSDYELFRPVLKFTRKDQNEVRKIKAHNAIAAAISYLCLHDLQHRGQESSGIAVYNGTSSNLVKKMGKVKDIYTLDDLLALPGNIAIGHNRYSTYGSSEVKNAHPLHLNIPDLGDVYLCVNGNYTNAQELRIALEEQGANFTTNVDSEVGLHLIDKTQGENLTLRVVDAFSNIKGANTSLVLSEGSMIGYRDKKGYRPLKLAKIGNSYILSSEDGTILRNIASVLGDRVEIKDVAAGEMIQIVAGGIIKTIFENYFPLKQCMFELVYIARADSTIFSIPVSLFRIELGKQLAREHPVDADFVCPVPDSGNLLAAGYSIESGIPYMPNLMRDHYAWFRTFIHPDDKERGVMVRAKQIPINSLITGYRNIWVDDSQVRNKTAKVISKIAEVSGAKESHWRFGLPPVIDICRWGTDIAEREELVAAIYSKEKIMRQLGPNVKSMEYLSLGGLQSVIDQFNPTTPEYHKQFCYHCITGRE